MAITVSDIEEKQFATKGAGYDPYDVDQYLDQICDEMVAMQERIDQLEADLAKARQAAQAAAAAVQPVAPEVVRNVTIEPVAKASETLENILLSAQKLADGAVEDARRKADTILREAQDKAADIIADAREEKATLEKSVEALHAAAGEFKKNFLTLLDGQKQLLESNVSLFTGEKK
ncbi:MAG: DivIVA domain-containing protein [Clostridiales bacterium]|nr:DivIVA domain-containing protein [Clostridiales bacterium]